MNNPDLLRKRILLHTLAHSVYKKHKVMQEWQARQDEYAVEQMRYRRVRRKRVV